MIARVLHQHEVEARGGVELHHVELEAGIHYHVEDITVVCALAGRDGQVLLTAFIL